jgi:AraC family transcriptional regulator
MGTVTASGFADLLDAPPNVSAAWKPFSLFVVGATPGQATAAFADHALGIYLSGRHRIRREMDGRPVEGWSDPGTVNLTPASVPATWQASGPSRAIVLLLPDAFLARVISEHWEADPRNVEIIPQFLAHDPVIQGVATRLALEAQSGSQSEPYVESACEFLAHHMIHSYSTLSARPPKASGGIPARRLKLILDYIEENLAQPIALRQLGELAGTSIRHFERAFRQATGVPPHAYVVRKRVARAQNLLLSEPRLTIDEIAMRAGFSSSSHLSSTFRRQTGYSPTAFRRLLVQRGIVPARLISQGGSDDNG